MASYRKRSSKEYGKKKPKKTTSRSRRETKPKRQAEPRQRQRRLVVLKKPSPKVQQVQTTVAAAQTQAAKQVQPQASGRPFAGFKAKLHFNHGNLAISTDVRYAKMDRKDLLPQIVMKDTKGREVEYRPDVKYHYAYFVKGTDERVDETDVRFYQVTDGKEVEVSKFERTSDIKVEKLLPATEMDVFLPDSYYEVWSDDPEAVFRIADYLDKTDQVGVAKLSFGGFKQYYAVIYPARFGDEFALCLMLTTGRKTYQHLMPIASKADEYKETQKKVVGVLEEI